MSEPFIGEIKMFAGNFPPRGYAFCDGQTLDISSHTALFSILGTMYGGDGRTNFKLPDLRGRLAVHAGSGPGLPTVTQGEQMGSVQGPVEFALQADQIPDKPMKCNRDEAEEESPEGNYPAFATEDVLAYHSESNAEMAADGTAVQPVRLSLADRDPSLGIRYIIALSGVFPSRS